MLLMPLKMAILILYILAEILLQAQKIVKLNPIVSILSEDKTPNTYTVFVTRIKILSQAYKI